VISVPIEKYSAERLHDYPQLERSASGLVVPSTSLLTSSTTFPSSRKVAFFRTPFSVAGKSPLSSPHSPIFPGNVSNNIDITDTGINSRPDQITLGNLSK
jgi:hypothetical protein